MQRRISDLLRLAGLKEEEIILYIELLKLKRSAISELIATSGLNVMTAYRTIRRLCDRGLVSVIKLNNKQSVYKPLSLAALIKSIEARQRKLGKLGRALAGVDPLLKYIDSRESPDELIEIREGIDAFLEEYLKIPDMCGGEFMHLGSMEHFWKLTGTGDESAEELGFRNKRYRRNVYARCINTDSPVIRAVQQRDSKEFRTLKIADSIPVTRDYITFAKDYIAHFVCDSDLPRVILIRHPELNALHREHFKAMWDKASA